jgi:hypothetical protein
MNTFEFIARNFSRYVLPNGLTNDPVRDSAVALTMNHLLENGKTSRLTGWMIVHENGTICQSKLAAAGITGGDPRTRFQAFSESLETWSGTVCFLTFTKSPINLSNVYLTFDPRWVRVCSPDGVESFDWTAEPSDKAGMAFRNMHKARMKRQKDLADAS